MSLPALNSIEIDEKISQRKPFIIATFNSSTEEDLMSCKYNSFLIKVKDLNLKYNVRPLYYLNFML